MDGFFDGHRLGTHDDQRANNSSNMHGHLGGTHGDDDQNTEQSSNRDDGLLLIQRFLLGGCKLGDVARIRNHLGTDEGEAQSAQDAYADAERGDAEQLNGPMP